MGAHHPQLIVVETRGFPDYALIDSGEGRKLERFGSVLVDRPEPQAMWSRRTPEQWTRADATFVAAQGGEEKGRWQTQRAMDESWPVSVMGATMLCRLGSFWHLGLFPEQTPHWEWMLEGLQAVRGERPRVLNLFAYTGAASLIAAAAGAEVTHVDASKPAIAWARENQSASGLADAPIRWILDDARKFAAREVRRGRTYDVVLLDPPKFGRGPGGEIWEVFDHLAPLLADCAKLLAPTSRLVLTAYAIRASALAMDGLVRDVLGARGGRIVSGELAVLEHLPGGRALPTSLFCRWSSPNA
jgi:23S rRNA (cytosine1962-C5)-methyltransferase